MKLLVIRHAIAENKSSTGSDADRPVSQKGCEKFNKICKILKPLNWKFELLLDSPLLRSQQTADIFCKYFFVQTKKRTFNLKPLAETSQLLSEIETYGVSSAVLIGASAFFVSIH